MTTYLGKSCSFCLPRVPFVNCRQFMYLVISLLVLRAGYGIWLYQFLIIAYLFTFHLYKILLPYTTLSYHIEIEPNRPTAETSRIGTPSKFTQAEKSRPERPKLCCLHSQNAEIIWTGLQSHSSAKKRFFFCANLRENRKQSTLH